MTAFGGGGRPTGGIPNPMSSVLDRPAGDGGTGLRPIEQIFPLPGDANRGREMQMAWRSFCRDRLEAVRGVMALGRSPPEIAYQLGELLHNHFRTRGATLTSFELRRLVAELLALHGKAENSDGAASPPAPVSAPVEPQPEQPQPVVAFEREPPKVPWQGDAPSPAPAPQATVPDKALEPPPSPIVTVAPREAVHEVAGLGLIERLWSDPAVRAIFVNGPQSVLVERDGALQPATERFGDEAQLTELVTRLIGWPASGLADFQLRDGSRGFVILPPAAPAGPVLTLRRAEPGQATLGRLVAAGMLDGTVAELLRLCVRSRLNMLITGPQGSGKTALLAALLRDLDPALRIVTVSSHRHFQSPAESRVELLASAATPFAILISAAARFDPAVLVLDGMPPEDVPALAQHLAGGGAGTLAAVGPAAMSATLARSVDVVVRTDRFDGQLRVVAVEDSAGVAAFALEDGRLARGKPAFAATLQARGAGDVIGKWFA